MGTLKGGSNGTFSGKVGSVIGSNWRKISYIKGLPKTSHKQASEAQLLQREKFQLIVKFIYNILPVIEKGRDRKKTQYTTAANVAVSYNALHALNPDGCEINFSRIMISDGSLPKAADAYALWMTEKCLRVYWNPIPRSPSTSADDEATLLLYWPGNSIFLSKVAAAFRSDGSIDIPIDPMKSTEICHLYIFFTSPKGISSPSFYMGELSALNNRTL
ncbi:hypothetical protein ADIARSV_1131 [Arcticibacter svalbardensis MN12-7]|uniref:Uncharacterized protein n=1 Tax=Arcticibacter svalbardensis MN12-7 TaxID=1150600 RepID=R9GVX1_9SPHI|nr:DUF6266 family protein [Arcticibacter svalbardensis]EOR95818.1 hypothetical protein ADIARSV_1131 [Arcticibacter svalbardensis MN12-7]